MWKSAQAYPFAPDPLHPGVSPMTTPVGDATHVIWQDPTSYNPFFHGPPYLPGMKVRVDKTASEGDSRSMLVAINGLVSVLVFLRSLSLIHQSHHWLTSGENYYSDHLLFERLYNQTQEEIDKVGEKAVGAGDLKYIYPGPQSLLISQVVGSLCNGSKPGAFVEVSVEAERRFILHLRYIMKQMEAKGFLTKGIDNLLAGIEDTHEGHLYLLDQRMKRNSDPWKAEVVPFTTT
jgi:hypothetical protein